MPSNKIGALWLREAKSGLKYMSGEIEIDGQKRKIAVFKNDKGDNEKRPDYNIVDSEDSQQQSTTSHAPAVGGGFKDDVPF